MAFAQSETQAIFFWVTEANFLCHHAADILQ
jgi:hypothetical protein